MGDLPPLLQAELQLKIRRAQYLDLQTQELKGRLHDAEECRRRRIGLIQGAKARLLDLARSVATDLAGRDREEIERVLDERVRRILEEWARGSGDFTAEGAEGAEKDGGGERTKQQGELRNEKSEENNAAEGAAQAGDGAGG